MKSQCLNGMIGLLLLAATFSVNAAEPTREKPAPLFTAIRNGDKETVVALLRKGTPVNAAGEDGATPLMNASLYASADLVKLLLDKGADANAANPFGATALMWGAVDAAKVKLLLEAGAKPNAQTKDGQTALILAASCAGNLEAVKALLGKGADVNASTSVGNTALMRAAIMGDVDTMKALLAAGAKVNVKTVDGPTAFFSGWRTPLMWASLLGHTDAVRLLLDAGADVNGRDLVGTALIQAVWKHQYDVAKILLERGADVNASSESPVSATVSGFTPLMWACLNDHDDPRLVELLLKSRAKLDVESDVGDTPLSLARRTGADRIAQVLIAAGARDSQNAAANPEPAVAKANVNAGLTVRQRAEKSLARLQASSATFVAHRETREKCFSCHHQSLPAIALGLARQRGYSFDAAGAARQQMQVVRDSESRQQLRFVLSGSVDVGSDSGFALFGLAGEQYPADSITDSLVHALAAGQQSDGRWPDLFPRMPISSSDVATTALAIRALKEYGWAGRRQEFDARIARGKAWLSKTEALPTDEKAFKLLGLSWAGAGREEIAKAAANLQADQRPDGGWAQLPRLSSDAYATGQTLYALHVGGGVATTDAVYQRGVKYLMDTQAEDGTWLVHRRCYPFQPHFNGGFPYGKDQWISAAATSWAAAALTLTAEPARAAAR
jgi:ankyrin repeat protein